MLRFFSCCDPPEEKNYSSILLAGADLTVLQYGPCIPIQALNLYATWRLLNNSVGGLLPLSK